MNREIELNFSDYATDVKAYTKEELAQVYLRIIADVKAMKKHKNKQH